jgi:Fic family protein
MRIIDEKYFDRYNDLIGNQIESLCQSFDFTERDTDVRYLTQASAVYSSNIEGNSIDLNSFMNSKLSQEKFKPRKEIQEIENLIAAYEFAQNNPLTERNFLHCHQLFSKTLVIKSKQGKYRNEKVGVFGQSGLVYLAVEPELVKTAMSDFFSDLNMLLKMELTKSKVFYFASLIHLKFAHIHPFRDGNGRAARLLEKWFLATKLGIEFWKLSSEKYYKEHQMEYYSAINLGLNFYELDYNKCIPFLLMLPQSLEKK